MFFADCNKRVYESTSNLPAKKYKKKLRTDNEDNECSFDSDKSSGINICNIYFVIDFRSVMNYYNYYL